MDDVRELPEAGHIGICLANCSVSENVLIDIDMRRQLDTRGHAVTVK